MIVQLTSKTNSLLGSGSKTPESCTWGIPTHQRVSRTHSRTKLSPTYTHNEISRAPNGKKTGRSLPAAIGFDLAKSELKTVAARAATLN
jgi:hypothetical protein